MRIEDGIFGEMATIDQTHKIDDTLPLHTQTLSASPHDVSSQAFNSDGTRNQDYIIDRGTVLNTDGLPAEAGDDVYEWPGMAGKCVKIYTSNYNGNIKVRPFNAKDDGTDDITIAAFSGMMLPLPCKGLELVSNGTIIILA